ncbi:MAG: SLC13 family permease [Gammaproteobacteria bacterium]
MHLPVRRASAALLVLLLVALPAAAGVEPTLQPTRDPVSQALVAALIAGVFVLLALEKAHRVLVIASAVGFMWLVTYLTPWHLLPFDTAQNAIDLNVLVLLASMMAVVGVLKTTGIFSYAVGKLLRLSGGRTGLIVALMIWFTGILSSVADNVTTVIFATPMALELAARLRIRPLAILLPMVMASNIGGTATLIGDPPNILIGSGAGLSFMDFVLNLTAPVLLMLVILESYSSRYFAAEHAGAVQRIDPDTLTLPAIENPTLLRWGLTISGLIFLGFLTHSLTGMPASIPAAVGAAALLVAQDVLYLRTRGPSMDERIHGILRVMQDEIEWPTLSFFALLFMAVGAAVATGLIDTVSQGLASFIHWGAVNLDLTATGTLFFAALLVLWASGVLSALIDNIPYVAVTIPIIATLTGQLQGDTEILWWALSLGACLGGNGTPIGASANVTVIGLAEREGHRISFGEFARFGARVTVMTLAISSVFIAAHLYLGPIIAHGTMLAGLVAVFLVRASTRKARRPQAV